MKANKAALHKLKVFASASQSQSDVVSETTHAIKFRSVLAQNAIA